MQDEANYKAIYDTCKHFMHINLILKHVCVAVVPVVMRRFLNLITEHMSKEFFFENELKIWHEKDLTI